MGMIKHCQSTSSNKFAISLQYLKKDVRAGICLLRADKRESFYKLALSLLVEVTRHVQSTQNYIFCRDILPGSSYVHCYLFIYKFQDTLALLFVC